jgi:hypothetical protein
MPIARHNGKLIYYAHVPKCAGSSVEAYLERRFGELAFVDRRHTTRQISQRWTMTSPQHVDVDALALLFPQGFFDVSFAVVRHPVNRIVSAFHFQREVERTIPQSLSFSEWLSGLPDEFDERPWAHDNHVRPMTVLIPQDAMIFHLEHGLDALVSWLDMVCGDNAGPRNVPWINERHTGEKVDVLPSDTDRRLISEIYAEDFRRFGYTLDAKAPIQTPQAMANDNHTASPHADYSNSGSLERLRTRISRLIRQ